MGDLPQNCTECGSCLWLIVRAPSGNKYGGQHWTYGIDPPYLFRKVETVCLAVTIEGLLTKTYIPNRT